MRTAGVMDERAADGFEPANIELVIFDCDGVLIDSEIIATRTLSEALAEFGVTMSPLEVHLTLVGGSEGDVRIYCQEKLGISDVDGLLVSWRRRLYEGFVHLEEIEGIADVVSSLRCPVCVASNSSLHRLTRSLGRLDLWRAFKGHVFGADHVKNPKPAPDLMLHCALEMKAEPQRCVVIDDNQQGIRAAVAAGMVPIGFVDVNDPRPRRAEILRDAGALFVATGSLELGGCLQQADALLGRKLETSRAG